MNKNDHINMLVDETLNCMENASRATAPHFLLSRINQALKKTAELSFWEKIAEVITRPLIAIPALLLVIFLNIFIITNNKSVASAYKTSDSSFNDAALLTTTSAFYDIETQEP